VNVEKLASPLDEGRSLKEIRHRATSRRSRRAALRLAAGATVVVLLVVLLYGGWQALKPGPPLVLTDEESAGTGNSAVVPIDPPDRPVLREEVLVRTSAASERGEGAVLGVSPNGQTIGVADVPIGVGGGWLRLYGRDGLGILDRGNFRPGTPHDSPFVRLHDLAVVSPAYFARTDHPVRP